MDSNVLSLYNLFKKIDSQIILVFSDDIDRYRHLLSDAVYSLPYEPTKTKARLFP